MAKADAVERSTSRSVKGGARVLIGLGVAIALTAACGVKGPPRPPRAEKPATQTGQPADQRVDGGDPGPDGGPREGG